MLMRNKQKRPTENPRQNLLPQPDKRSRSKKQLLLQQQVDKQEKRGQLR